MVGSEALPSELFTKARGVRGQRLLHGSEVLDALGERARDRAALPSRRYRLKVEAGNAAELVDQALADDGQELASSSRIQVAYVGDAIAAERLQLAQRRRPTPQISPGGIRTTQ